MRVLIDYRSALRTRSGVGEYAHELALAFARRAAAGNGGYQVDATLFSSSWTDRLDLDPSCAHLGRVDRRMPVALLNFVWHRLGWPPVEALAGGGFDVAHSLHPLLMPARRAAQVVTIHDLDFMAHPERTRAEIRRDYPALARAHARRADHVIVVSQFTAGEVARQFGVEPERMSVCGPGAPAWTPRPPERTGRYLLFLGTLEPRKNIGRLLDAYEALLADDDAGYSLPELVLAGSTTANSSGWLDRIARAPLVGRVRHLGYLAPDRRRAVFEDARMLIQPSFEEGFGMPVLEAMTAGVPVVASNRGALPEVLGDAGLLIDPESHESIAAAIRRLLRDPAESAACSRRGIERARAFNWETTSQRVAAAYELAIAHRQRLARKR